MALFGIFFMPGCSKQNKQTNTAQSYFKMAYTELSEQEEGAANYLRALNYIELALNEEEKPEYYALKATLLFKVGQLDEAAVAYKKALCAQPNPHLRDEITNNYACLLAHQGQVAQAQAMWRQLLGQTSYQTPEVALVNLGKSYLSEQKLAPAKEVLEKAVRVSPSYLDAHFYLACIARQLNDIVCAKREIDVVLSQEPGHAGALQVASQLGLPHAADELQIA